MYKKETISKVVKQLLETKKAYSTKSVDEIKMCISKGNEKIGKVLNVSLPPILTCSNCSECKYFCYDIKACNQYPNTVIDARIRNLVILQKDRNEYFGRIRKALKARRKNKYFRWHVSGDIVDIAYFAEMVAIAKEFPDFTFWTYTKNYKVVNQYVSENGNSKDVAIPENLHVMFSEWDGTELVNPYNFPIFTCKLKSGNKNHKPEFFDGLYKCPGNCDLCKANKLGCIGGHDTYADEH